MGRAVRPPARPALACTLLLLLAARVHADNTTTRICSSIEVRTVQENLRQLEGCNVIDGRLSILLLETEKSYEGFSFPELREITEYLLIYRLRHLRNLGDLFPNLSVVRGKQLYKDYAIVVFDNENLESLGLRSLTVVERGAVRIERNDRLCYVNTIDWSYINPNDSVNNIIRANYDVRFCGLCKNAQSRRNENRESASPCPSDSRGSLLCWDEKNCQKVCPSMNNCTYRGCLDNGTCCHSTCLGGCSAPGPENCYACHKFSLQEKDKKTVCMDSCPPNTYELNNRCVSMHKCRTTDPPQQPHSFSTLRQYAPSIHAYKIYNNTKCVYVCPSGTMEKGNASTATCEPCTGGGCVRECEGGKIDSVAAAEQYRACTVIRGKLEIALRASGGNTLSVLESSLGEITEIRGGLQVTRSYPLISLMFLKKLRKISRPPCPDCINNKGQVLHILNNPNLELLWDWGTHGPLQISGGTLYIHLNPKLCYDQLLPLANMTRAPSTNFTEIEVSAASNGNQASCLPKQLNLIAKTVADKAILQWDAYCPDDSRKLLGYSIYYVATESDVTIYERRDACSDFWNIVDITETEARNGTTDVQVMSENILFKDCQNLQPGFYLLTNLSPFTRYAAYVKTYTTQQVKKGAQSSIIYFRTLPGRPSRPRNLKVDPSSNQVDITWSPPAMPNGTIIHYLVEIQANSYNKDTILQGNVLDICNNPNALGNLIEENLDKAHELEESLGGAGGGGAGGGNGSCACRRAPAANRFTQRAGEESDDSIQFENDLQNLVYVKSNKNRTKNVKLTQPFTRSRRSAENQSLKRMLVKVSKNITPLPNDTYKNVSDDEDYVKSFYFKVAGSAASLSAVGLRHYTWYTVSVWACRARHPAEGEPAYRDTWCSHRAYRTVRTRAAPNADVVSGVRAALETLNKTQAEVNVTWAGPRDPNGFVVAYNVHYSRVDDGTQVQHMCIIAEEYEANMHSYLLRSLAPGNYSVQVSLITMRGPGNASRQVFILIPERTGYEWVWGVICGCLLVLLILAGVVWYVKRGFLPPTEAHKLFASVNPEYVSTVYVPDEWEVPRASVDFIRELGQGSFGMVYEGLAKNIEKGKPETRCAVKTVNEHATDRERIEFLKEASVMKAFDTFHVVRLLGVVSRGQPTLVVMELMECGDLKTYLRSHRPDDSADNTPPTLQNILQMAIEIADGMAYLSAKKFVHRDLAARNCMVAGDLTVKVGDFGMTRDIYETDYYRKGTKGLLPVRWMSPESLKDGVFSSSSDVWSYGVVLWEMATLAMQPYQGLSNEQVVRYVVEGGVMERPEHCPDRLYELMRACWAHRPLQRPSFLALAADLAPSAKPYFRHRSFFHSPQGQEIYALQRTNAEEECAAGGSGGVAVGAVGSGSGSNLFGVSGRLASWVRELSSLRSRADPDAAAEPLQPLQPPNGALPP